MKPNYEQLEKKVKFYRVVTVVMAVTILFIGFNNVSTTQSAQYYEEQYGIKKAKADFLQKEVKKEQRKFKDALCLKRIPELDKALNGKA